MAYIDYGQHIKTLSLLGHLWHGLKFIGIDDLEVRKLCCEFVIERQQTHHPDTVLTDKHLEMATEGHYENISIQPITRKEEVILGLVELKMVLTRYKNDENLNKEECPIPEDIVDAAMGLFNNENPDDVITQDDTDYCFEQYGRDVEDHTLDYFKENKVKIEKKQNGEFYTPQQVAKGIVAMIHRNRVCSTNCVNGLNDTNLFL